MTDVQRQVLATYIFDLEVKNGGLDQFYLNHADKYIDDAIASLKRFATPEFADIAENKNKFIFMTKHNSQTGVTQLLSLLTTNITHSTTT